VYACQSCGRPAVGSAPCLRSQTQVEWLYKILRRSFQVLCVHTRPTDSDSRSAQEHKRMDMEMKEKKMKSQKKTQEGNKREAHTQVKETKTQLRETETEMQLKGIMQESENKFKLLQEQSDRLMAENDRLTVCVYVCIISVVVVCVCVCVYGYFKNIEYVLTIVFV